MLPPSVLVAVTVALATGSPAAFLMIPTIAPAAILTPGVGATSASETRAISEVAMMAIRQVSRIFGNFMILYPVLLLVDNGRCPMHQCS
jgi:hypothetical protein